MPYLVCLRLSVSSIFNIKMSPIKKGSTPLPAWTLSYPLSKQKLWNESSFISDVKDNLNTVFVESLLSVYLHLSYTWSYNAKY